MLELSESVLSRVIQEFDSAHETKPPSVYSIYIFYMIKSGLILFEDQLLPHAVLTDLINNRKIKPEGIHFHQGEKCIRYRVLGHKYPDKFYRSISPALKKLVREKCDNECVKCGSVSRLEYDHIFPWSKGGLTEICNLQLLCYKCNSEKANKI